MIRQLCATILGVAVASAAFAGCDGGQAKAVGSEGGPCTSGGACDPGLACYSKVCVDTATPTSTGTETKTTTSTGEGPYLQVTSGMRHSCAIKKDQTVVCWGYNGTGQLAAPSGTFTQVSGGILHTCGIRTDGSATCWGGLSSCPGKPVPSASYTKIAAGSDYTCGLTAQATVLCWGCTDDVVPSILATDLSAGGAYDCAISNAAKLVCWGPHVPSSLPSRSGLDAVSVFFGYGCVHAGDGSFSCWELGGTSTEDEALPVDGPAGPFTKVRAGAGHFCGIREDQTVECWGFNDDGQTKAPAGKFLDVAPGGFHTCGLKTDHTIVCWGDRTDGATTPPAAR
jgi:hypothetical protein